MTTSEETTLVDQLESAFICGQPGLLLRSFDPVDVQDTLVTLVHEYDNWALIPWDAHLGAEIDDPDLLADWFEAKKQKLATAGISAGVAGLNKPADGVTINSSLEIVSCLYATMRSRKKRFLETGGELNRLPKRDNVKLIFLLKNGHRELNPMQPDKMNTMLAGIQSAMTLAKSYDGHLVVLSPPGVELPEELREQFWIFDHELPNADEREKLIVETVTGSCFDEPVGEQLAKAVSVTGGLTRIQVEGAIARSLARNNGQIDEGFIWKLKATMINKSGLLTVHRGKEKFDSYTETIKDQQIIVPGIGGLDGIKRFSKRMLQDREGLPAAARPKGMLLLGVPGTGKSAFVKALGNELGRPTLVLDIGSLMGSLVGQTEERTRMALRTVDAMAPAILFVDELEKAIGGKGGEMDGGVGSRMRGALLTWMNDHESDVFFVATANDIKMLPPEMTRAERFDVVFFMDIPQRTQKDAIWDIYLKVFQLDPEQPKPKDKKWTGAEIKACCKLACMMRCSLLEAANFVVPVMDTWGEKIQDLREWATKKCIDAESGMKYVYHEPSKKLETAAAAAPVNTGVSEHGRKTIRRRLNSGN